MDDALPRVGDRVVIGTYAGVVAAVDGDEVELRTESDPVRLARPFAWRAVMDAAEARRVAAALCAPPAPDASPPRVEGDELPARVAALEGLPRDALVDLARFYFWARDRLDRDAAYAVRPCADALLREVACALAMPHWALVAAVRRGDATLAPLAAPAALASHAYIGAFEVTSGELVLADPCYARERRKLLAVRVPGARGRWHAYVHPDADYPARIGALLAVHERHLALAPERGDPLGSFGVDSGQGAVIDAGAVDDDGFLHALTHAFDAEHGAPCVVGGRACLSRTAFGDGVFDARGVRRGGPMVMVRLNLAGDPAYDALETPAERAAREIAERTAGKSDAAFRAYSPSVTFAAGDLVRHARFGDGYVLRVVDPQKIEVAFPDGARVLAHGRG